jgi:hypothetical protein
VRARGAKQAPIPPEGLRDYAVIICGGSTYHEPCLAPDIEDEAVYAFSKLAEFLEAYAAVRRAEKKGVAA